MQNVNEKNGDFSIWIFNGIRFSSFTFNKCIFSSSLSSSLRASDKFESFPFFMVDVTRALCVIQFPQWVQRDRDTVSIKESWAFLSSAVLCVSQQFKRLLKLFVELLRRKFGFVVNKRERVYSHLDRLGWSIFAISESHRILFDAHQINGEWLRGNDRRCFHEKLSCAICQLNEI